MKKEDRFDAKEAFKFYIIVHAILLALFVGAYIAHLIWGQ